MAADHGRHIVRLAEGRAGNLVACDNKSLCWGELCERLGTARRDRITLKQFLALPLEEQGRLKGMDGWFVGGVVANGRRNRKNMQARELVTIDADGCEPDALKALLDGTSPLCRYEFALHTTRKHRPDKPRYRIVMPAKAPIARELYEPVTRILAAKIDPTLDGIDDASFRDSQLMFFPTLCRDSEWLFHHNKGDLLDAETVLNEYPLDWRNFANLPHSEKRSKARRKANKAEDPLEKKNFVGTFCRAFTVTDVIELFLSDFYTPGDDSGQYPRYTYAAGSVANGAIVYDDGRFLYSHHDTDPAGHKLLNAFDLARLHLYGDRDEKVDVENTSASELPSFKAMKEWAVQLPEVREQIIQDNYDLVAMFDDADEENAAEIAGDNGEDSHNAAAGKAVPAGVPVIRRRVKPEKPQEGWQLRDLEYDKFGNIKPTLHNVATIIANDPRMWSVIGLNAFTNKPTARRTLRSEKLTNVPTIWVDDPVNGVPWSDTHDASLRAILEAPRGRGKAGWSCRTKIHDLKDAVRLVAENWWFHPVQEYFERLDWDGVERIEGLWSRYLGVPDTPYARETARLFIIAVIARVYCPGHKWDYVPILSGPQGIRKSTFIKALFGEDWAGELTVEMASNKDAAEQMLGKLCLELPELAHMRMGQVTKVKEFITLQVDRCRFSYDRRMSNVERQCVFMGTSNESEYLKDPTGNRRFWPLRVEVPMIDTDALIEARDQIWAEGWHLWAEMCRKQAERTGDPNAWRHLPLTLSPEATREAEALQEIAREEDSIEATAETIRAWLDKPEPLSNVLDPGDETSGFTETDEPLVVRVRTCPREAYCEGLGFKLSDLARNRSLETTAGSTLRAVAGWKKTGRRHVFARYGQCSLYVREDATPQELQQGYRVVKPSAAEGVSSLKLETVAWSGAAGNL